VKTFARELILEMLFKGVSGGPARRGPPPRTRAALLGSPAA